MAILWKELEAHAPAQPHNANRNPTPTMPNHTPHNSYVKNTRPVNIAIKHARIRIIIISEHATAHGLDVDGC